MFCIAPEAFDAVDKGSPLSNSFLFGHGDMRPAQPKTGVSPVFVSVVQAADGGVCVDNGQQFDSATCRNGKRSNMPIPLVDAEYDRFATSTTSANTFGPPSTEVRLVDFDVAGDGGLVLAVFGDSSTDGHKVGVDCVAAQAGRFGDLGGVKIQAKELENLSELSLRNS